MRGHRIFAAVYAAALIAFTGYIALDTFVLEDVYQTDTTEMNLTMFAEESSSAALPEQSTRSGSTGGAGESRVSRHSRSSERSTQQTQTAPAESSTADTASASVSSENSYMDDNIAVTLSTYRAADTTVYAADVQLSSAQYLKSAFAYDTYGKNVTAATSETAAAHNAILAVNGDYYGAQERGYVIRNGIVYRDSSNGKDLLCVYADGSMKIVNSDDYSAEELVEQGVWQAYCFGPALLENGSISVSQNEEVGRAMASNPRTAIGIIDDLHYVLIVSDGRTDESTGLSLYQLAEFMQQLGVKTAYNLDGGGSSTMYFQGQVVNNPTTNGNRIQERGVSDIVYIG
ncbi:MAG: phosphodiester glycosidase family protein [Oscillospiraceae bacterium]|nr:phosphodiester glycosidase family protein [Oscillospiraceae bacterium]